MTRNSFLIASGDLIILFLFGAGLCYFHEDFLTVDASAELVASFIMSFILGCFGPSLGEIFEWALFFCLGIIVVSFYPYADSIKQSSSLPLADMFIALRFSFLYCLDLLAVWIIGIPCGYIFYKITGHSTY